MNSLTSLQFDALDKEQKADIIYAFGVYLSHYTTPRYIFSLYSLYSFYVEITYKAEKKVLVRITTFTKTDELKKYLDKIDISDIGLD
jgi:hypothetical protein